MCLFLVIIILIIFFAIVGRIAYLDYYADLKEILDATDENEE